MIYFILDIAGWTLILWLFFIVAATLKDKYESGNLPKWSRFIIYPIILLFVIFDGAYNIIYGSILFLQWPHKDRLLLTARLKYILRCMPNSWRGRLALFFCKYLIEPWDVGHCGLK